MKSEKGKPAFPDNVDEVLAGKIMDHTKKNSDNGAHGEGGALFDAPSRKNNCCGNMSKFKCIALCCMVLLLIAGTLAFFIFKPWSVCCGKKKKGFPFIF
jgi:hypothetical protein